MQLGSSRLQKPHSLQASVKVFVQQSDEEMRRRLLGLLLTCVVFRTNASACSCPTHHLRRAVAAATAEDASAECVFCESSAANPSTVSEMTPSALPRATKTASFPTKREDEAAHSSLASQTSMAAEEERLSVAVRGRSEGRSLRQNDGLDDEAPDSEILVLFENTFLTPILPVSGLPCSLSKRTLRKHLNETTRTWRISRSLLDEVEDDIQVIVNCTRPGDVLTFTARRIRPSSRVVIPWPLTLTASVDSFEVEEGVFPRSGAKATFTCPNRREGVFLVK